MMTKINARAVALSIAISVTFSIFGQAVAQQVPQCAPRETMVDALAKKYGESVVGRGLNVQGNMVEVFSAEDGSSWTILVTSNRVKPDGTMERISCLATEGQNWRESIAEPAGTDL